MLQGERPHTGHTPQLDACDMQLRVVSYPLDRARGLRGGGLDADRPNRILQLSQMIRFMLTCDHRITKWAAG